MKLAWSGYKAKRPSYAQVVEEQQQPVENRQEHGLPLTIALLVGFSLCCLAWSATIWYHFGTEEQKVNDVLLSSKLTSGGSHPESGIAVTYHEEEEDTRLQCKIVPVEMRFDCHPNDGVDEMSCLSRGCCWHPPIHHGGSSSHRTPLNVPYCFYPAGHQTYKLEALNRTRFGITGYYVLNSPSGYPKDVEHVKVQVMYKSETHLQIKIVDAQHKRFEVPYLPESNQKMMSCDKLPNKCHYHVEMGEEGFGIRVTRKSNGQVLFDTVDVGALIFSNQFLQISTLLESQYIYGLGEHRKHFRKSTHWQQLSMWNADQWPAKHSTNLYGSHPFYMSISDQDGSAHGVFLKNSNALEVVLQPTPALTFRALGGILDLNLFLGPSAQQVVQQYTTFVGKPFLPPYWSLGYHQCKFGYGSLQRTQQVLQQTQKAAIPIDVQWNDIDYMDQNKDFTFDHDKYKGLPEFVQQLHKDGLHYVPIIDPGISGSEAPGTYPPYDAGLHMDIFIKNSSGQPFVGKVWNRVSTVWPDFTHTKAPHYWTNMLARFHDKVPIDGAWIDMNEPSNFYDGQVDGCNNDNDNDNELNNPPYVPRTVDGNSLYHKTVCPSAQQEKGVHYDLHNMYGFTEALVTHNSLVQIRHKRPFIISRSTFPGQGHYGGHWTGDVLSDWSSMRDSISGMLDFNLFGIPMVGADICGFNGNTTVKLCQRWAQLGAFYPFSRNHNTDTGIDQDPVSLGPEVVESAKNALVTRYTLLPYLYTLFVKAHLFGSPVVTPTFFHTNPVDDKVAYTIDTQFHWGRDLLIVPALYEDETKVTAYLPKGTWYNYRSLEFVGHHGFVELDAPLNTIPVLARGGAIFPAQLEGAKTTTQSRHVPFDLRVYLANDTATGDLYWDDGDSLDTYKKGTFTRIEFKSNHSSLSSNVIQHKSTLPLPSLGKIIIVGLPVAKQIHQVVLNNKPVPFEAQQGVLKVGSLTWDMTKPFTLDWK